MKTREEKIYISGPITGHDDYYERFSVAEEYLKNEGYYKILNPAEIMFELPRLEYEDYMRVAMALLKAADEIYLLPGWEKSPGARRECRYAIKACKGILAGTEESLRPIKEARHTKSLLEEIQVDAGKDKR